MGKIYWIGRESGGIVNNSVRLYVMFGNFVYVFEFWFVSIGDLKLFKV